MRGCLADRPNWQRFPPVRGLSTGHRPATTGRRPRVSAREVIRQPTRHEYPGLFLKDLPTCSSDPSMAGMAPPGALCAAKHHHPGRRCPRRTERNVTSPTLRWMIRASTLGGLGPASRSLRRRIRIGFGWPRSPMRARGVRPTDRAMLNPLVRSGPPRTHIDDAACWHNSIAAKCSRSVICPVRTSHRVGEFASSPGSAEPGLELLSRTDPTEESHRC